MTSPSQFLFTSSCLYSLNTSGFKYSRWWWWWWWWWWRRWRWVMGMKGKYSTPYRNALTSGMCMLSCHWHIQNSAVCVCVCVCVCVFPWLRCGRKEPVCISLHCRPRWHRTYRRKQAKTQKSHKRIWRFWTRPVVCLRRPRPKHGK